MANFLSASLPYRPELASEPFHREGWVYEEKLDGWRMVAYKDGLRVRLVSLLDVFQKVGLDPKAETPGRQMIRHQGQSLVRAMEMALKAGKPEAAQLVSAECVVLAETKDHLNWGVIGELSKTVKGDDGKALREAFKEIEEQEDEHLYHSTGWTRELWIESLGMPAVLPPPEEEKDAKTAIGAARAKKARKTML